MSAVERVKQICKDRGIPLSRIEKDLGFGNGYIGRLKKGTFPNDRLIAIANYLNVPIEDLTAAKTTIPAYHPITNSPEIRSRLYEVAQTIIHETINAICDDDLYLLTILFSKLNQDGQAKLYDYLEDLLQIGKYTSDGRPFVFDWDAYEKEEVNHAENTNVSSAEADYEKAFGIQSKQESRASSIIEDVEKKAN